MIDFHEPDNNSDATEIAFILDRSGSMQPLTEAAISGFNEFLLDQKESEGVARLTLVLFDDQYLVPVDNVPVADVAELDETTFVPRGSTALLDAIGRTIVEFAARYSGLEECDRPENVVFAIYTDGLENSSLEYDWKMISQLIQKHRDEDGWEFLFLAANQDAVATAAQMNIRARDSATSSFSQHGIGSSTRAFSRKIKAMRSKDKNDLADFHKSMGEILEEEEDKQS